MQRSAARSNFNAHLPIARTDLRTHGFTHARVYARTDLHMQTYTYAQIQTNIQNDHLIRAKCLSLLGQKIRNAL